MSPQQNTPLSKMLARRHSSKIVSESQTMDIWRDRLHKPHSCGPLLLSCLPNSSNSPYSPNPTSNFYTIQTCTVNLCCKAFLNSLHALSSSMLFFVSFTPISLGKPKFTRVPLTPHASHSFHNNLKGHLSSIHTYQHTCVNTLRTNIWMDPYTYRTEMDTVDFAKKCRLSSALRYSFNRCLPPPTLQNITRKYAFIYCQDSVNVQLHRRTTIPCSYLSQRCT